VFGVACREGLDPRRFAQKYELVVGR